MSVCAICEYLSMPPRTATGTVGLMTRELRLVAAAVDAFGETAGEHHVLVHACPEHAVDAYRERVPGVRMAWRLGDERATPATRRNPEAVSASRA